MDYRGDARSDVLQVLDYVAWGDEAPACLRPLPYGACSAIDITLRNGSGSDASAPLPPYAGCLADGVSVGDAIRKDLEPLLMEFGVDLFTYGHVHSYESTWPVFNGTAVQRSFQDPRAPVHVLTGAAGPPGDPEDFSQPASFTRRCVRRSLVRARARVCLCLCM
jgi:hypothetical protein